MDKRRYKSVYERTNKKTGYKISEEISISIDGRLKTFLGSQIYAKNNKIGIYTVGFKFAKRLVNGDLKEEYVKDVIAHEYCHAWTDEGRKKSTGHGELFKEKCKILGCDSNAETSGDLHKEWQKAIRKENCKKDNSIAIRPKCKDEFYTEEPIGTIISRHYTCTGCNVLVRPIKSLIEDPKEKMKAIKKFIIFMLTWYKNGCSNPLKAIVKDNKVIVFMQPKIENNVELDLGKINSILKNLKYLKSCDFAYNKTRVFSYSFECTFDIEEVDLIKM